MKGRLAVPEGKGSSSDEEYRSSKPVRFLWTVFARLNRQD